MSLGSGRLTCKPGVMTAEKPEGPEPDTDLKAQFLQALARKKGQHADGVGGTGPESNKIHQAHGKLGGKRQFRRKSGG